MNIRLACSHNKCVLELVWQIRERTNIKKIDIRLGEVARARHGLMLSQNGMHSSLYQQFPVLFDTIWEKYVTKKFTQIANFA